MNVKLLMKEYVRELLYPPNDCKFCEKPINSVNKGYIGLGPRDNRQVLKVEEGVKRLEYVCNTCKEQLVIPRDPFCEYCHKPLEANKGKICLDCSKNDESIYNRSAVIYNDFVKEKLALYKYRGKESLSDILSMLLTIVYRSYYMGEKIDYLTFIPMHPRRMEERGFNQAEQLARLLHKYTGIPVLETLNRVKETDKQSKVSRRDRVIQLKDSFVVKEDVLIEITHKSILIIDDIYTTGSTLMEAAKVLKGSGAKKVQGLTLARAI